MDDARAVVTRHGAAVVAGDHDLVRADMLPDRVGQLIGSTKLPDTLVSHEVLELDDLGDGTLAAVIRYTAEDGGHQDLRSTWVQRDGTWLVRTVRNLPAVPPRLGMEGPGDDGLDAPHWEGLRAGELRIQRCTRCRAWVWAPRPICPDCHSFTPGWESVDQTGTVYAWTRTWQPFHESMSGSLPFVIVVVELPQAGNVRIVGVLDDDGGDEVAIGQSVRGRIEEPTDPNGWPILRWARTSNGQDLEDTNV